MNQRTCGNCRWYDGDDVSGSCRRHAPQPGINDGKREYQYSADWPTVISNESCGEWADATITPEQEAKRELVRRFALALSAQPHAAGTEYEAIWESAERMAAFEPKFDSGTPSA